MTTEIFRNMLQQEKKELIGLSHVIFDEIHYLADESRGTVWEESIIFMPPEIRLLGLSATIPNAWELADWIEEIKGHQVKVVQKTDRVVPLEHFVFHPFTGPTSLKKLQQTWVKKKKEEVSSGRVRRKRPNTHLDLVRTIKKRNGLPCLYFVFSRQQCELKALALSEKMNFLSADEKKQTEDVLEQVIEKYGLESWSTIHRLKKVFLRGIAFHHAGLLPALKELVEILFGKNLIKVMYATETFAVGINYPVRSVCFDAPTKWDGISFRPLTTLEYFQMAGRAGRRGIDEQGFVYTLADLDRYQLEDFPSTNPNEIEELISRFNIGYNSVLNLFKNHQRPQISVILNQNFATFQARNDKLRLERRLAKLKLESGKIRDVLCEEWGNLSCPQARILAQKRLRKRERKIRFIKGRVAKAAVAREISELKNALAQARPKRCSPEEQNRCVKRVEFYENIYREQLGLEERVSTMKVAGRFEEDLATKAAILEEMDYLKNEVLLPRGEFASQVYAQELLITEFYFAGFFHEWDEDQINSVMVAVDYEPRKGERVPRPSMLPFDQKPIKKIIRDLIYRYGVDEQEIRFFPSLSPLAYRWSKGCDFLELLNYSYDLQEGDIVSAFRRGIDLLRQTRAACLGEDPILATKLKNCMNKMDRDLVEVTL